MSYKFTLTGFEGPLDVLLDMIEARKLSISSVSLANIADEYIKHIKSLADFPIEEVANFLVVASTLMLIKSRSLLPSLELDKEEEGDIRDLEERLKILARIRELSKNIKASWAYNPMFSREAMHGFDFGFIEPKGITHEGIFKSLENLIKSFPKIQSLPSKTLEKIVSIEEKMLELVGRLTQKLKASFQEIVGSKNKMEVIIGFLAVLELIKQGALLVEQNERFGKIEMERNKES